MNTLSRVLSLAEREGYIRLFIEEGAPMAKLLHKVVNQAVAKDVRVYAGRLLTAYSQDQAERPDLLAKTFPNRKMLEPLSKREGEVLLLMADGCSNKEIASQLVISIGTVKRHVIHIFQKLGASNRTQAVAIARDLEIV
jgi:LuxR family maltose regulon positive regulatory protein